MRIREATIKEICPTGKDAIINAFVKNFNIYAENYGIDNYLRTCHFIAQCAHESAHFQTLEEYHDGSDYEGREDLGNVQPGDGKRFKGRGVIQLTGRANYKKYGGNFLVNNPELAATPRLSVLIAMEYWVSKGLNELADQDNIREITKRINGWYNGLNERQAYLSKIKKLLR